MNIYQQVHTSASPIDEVLASALTEYQSPIASDVMDFQIRLAASEATAITDCDLGPAARNTATGLYP